MRRARNTLALVIVLALLAVTIHYLRRATMSTNTDPVAGTRTEVVVEAAKKREPAYTLQTLTIALVTSCRIYVDAEIVEEVEQVAGDRFRFALYPALNSSDQRELHGCLEDARLDHVQLDVLAINAVPQMVRP